MLAVLYDKKIPDKVPHGDVTVDPKVAQAVFGDTIPEEGGNFLVYWMTESFSDRFFERHRKLREFLGFDFAHVFPREPLKRVGENEHGHPIIQDVWGGKVVAAPQSTEELEAPIPDIERASEYRFPEVEDFSFENLERWVNQSDLFTVCQMDTGFFKIYLLVGFTNYMYYVYDHKEELKLLMERLSELQIRIAREAVKRGADCIWLANDYAFNQGTFIKPDLLWELDFQYEKRIVDEVHRLGVPCVLHACGNQTEMLDSIMELGVDALHAIQPTAQNDIVSIKKRYGKKLSLIGNVDIARLLPFGSPWEVDQAVKDLIYEVGQDGGYVLTTCNGIMEDVPVENAITMHLACEKYGHYPLQAVPKPKAELARG
jgi:uroporphyrinogen decarboxylase